MNIGIIWICKCWGNEGCATSIGYMLLLLRYKSHCMGDVTDVLRSWMLGMGPLNLAKPRSICIAGPAGSGKKFMVYAIATDLGGSLMV